MCLKGTGVFGQHLKRSKTFLCGNKEPWKDFIVALTACMHAIYVSASHEL